MPKPKSIKTLCLIGFTVFSYSSFGDIYCSSFLNLASQRLAKNLSYFPEIINSEAQAMANQMADDWIKQYQDTYITPKRRTLIRHRVQRFWLPRILKYIFLIDDDPAIYQSLLDLRNRKILASGYASGVEQVCHLLSCNESSLDYMGFLNNTALVLRATFYGLFGSLWLNRNIIPQDFIFLAVPLTVDSVLLRLDTTGAEEYFRLLSFFASVYDHIRKAKTGRVYLQFEISNPENANDFYFFNFLFDNFNEPQLSFFVSKE